MYRKIVGLAKDTLVYGVGAFANTAVSVLLLPVYGRYMTQAEYGAYSVLRVAIVVLAIGYDLGVSSTLVRFYFDDQSDEDRRRMFGTAWVFSQGVALVITAILLLWAPQVSQLLVGKAGKAIYIQIIALQALFTTGIIVPQALFRARRQPWHYAVFSFANVLVMIVATAYFIVSLKMGLVGALLGMLVAAFVFYLVSLPITLTNIKLSLWVAKLKEMLTFGLPLVPHALAAWILNFGDRLLLRRFVDLSQIGIYSFGYNIAMGVSLVVIATQKSWAHFVFSSHDEMEESAAKQLFSRATTYYFIFLCAVSLAVAVYAPELLAIFGGGKYTAAVSIVPIVSMSYVFFGLYSVTGVGIGIKKKSHYSFLATGTGAAANIALNLFLIPRIGILGAALATVFAYIVMSAVILTVSQRLYPVSYETVRMSAAFVLGVAAFGASTFIHAGFGLSVALKVLVLAGYVVSLVIFRVIKTSEIARVRSLVFRGAM